MPGFSSITGDESIVFADNASFNGDKRTGKLQADGQLWIGSTASPHVVRGSITSPLGTLNIGFNSPNITLDLAGGTVGADSFGMQSGTSPVVPTGAGLVTFNGATAAAGVNPVQTVGTGANTMSLQVQFASAAAATDATKVGLAAFNSGDFTVDANGFVSASATGVGQTITGDSGGALSPTAGNWNIVSTATNGIETTGSGSTLTVAMATPYADGDFEFRSATSGATRTLSVTNTSDTASSQATFNHSVAGTSAGDTWSQFTIGTTRSFSLGIDNSDNDILKITTDTDGTVDPSSGTHVAGFTTTGYTELGVNASGTSDTNKMVSVRKDQNGGSLVYVDNNTAGTAAYSGFQAGSNGGDGLLVGSVSSAYTVDSTIAGYAYIHAIQGGGQGSLMVQADDFTFSQGAGNDVFMNADTNGAWTRPFQPVFFAYNSADDTGVTKGSFQTVDFDSEDIDTGGSGGTAGWFAADTAVAPKTGKYWFGATVEISSINTATRFEVIIVTTTKTINLFRVNPTAVIPTGSAAVSFSGGGIFNMALNDTAIVQVVVDGGAAGYTIEGSAGTRVTYFQGYLIA